MYLLFYNIFLYSYLAVIHLAAYWNPKALAWVKGRKDILEKIKGISGGKKTIWMHCASLGEFEQGRPLLEKLRKEYPEKTLILTFFSPSGYEVRKNYPGVDHIFYLPLGGKILSLKFIKALNPELVLWIKYDYWYHYLSCLHKLKIPVYLISASFRRKQPFFAWYGKLHRQMLNYFTHLFVQTENSQRLLEGILEIQKVTVSGDTRFDRVIEIAADRKEIPGISDFIKGKQVIVAGSTWPVDIEEIDHFANTREEIRFIIAPHEIHADNLRDIKKLLPKSITYSQLLAGAEPGNVLIIDNIGMLSHLYRYATIAYIGGGFGDEGVHNVLEAAVFGVPLVFGPVFDKFLEAIDLLEEGAAFTVMSALELEETLDNILNNDELYTLSAETAKKYVYRKAGATEIILESIKKMTVRKTAS